MRRVNLTSGLSTPQLNRTAVKPYGPNARINWNHPLLRNVGFLVPFLEGAGLPREYVSGKIGTLFTDTGTTAKWRWGPSDDNLTQQGMGPVIADEDDRDNGIYWTYSDTALPDIVDGSSVFTAFAVFQIGQFDWRAGSFEAAFMRSGDGSSRRFALETFSDSTCRYLLQLTGTTAWSGSIDATIPAENKVDPGGIAVAVLTYVANEHRTYFGPLGKCGLINTSTTRTGNIPTASQPSSVSVGSYLGGVTSQPGTYMLCGVCATRWSQEEVRSFSLDPFQFFMPAAGPFHFPAPAAGGGTTTVSVPDISHNLSPEAPVSLRSLISLIPDV